MIDWHSERFKKVAIWIMAGLLVLFLVGSWQLRQIIPGLRPRQGPDVEVTVLGRKADLREYFSFRERWKWVIEGESEYWKRVSRYRMYMQKEENPEERGMAEGYARYFNFRFPYMPIKDFLYTEDHRVTSMRLSRLLDKYLDNFYARYKEAEKMGIQVSERRIDESVKTNFLFQYKDEATERWSFNEQEYATQLRNWGLTESAYRRFLLEQLMIEEMERMYLGLTFLGNTPVSPIEMAENLARRSEQRRVRYVKATLSSFMADARVNVDEQIKSKLLRIDDEDLKAFYEDPDNRHIYATPRKVRGDCLYVSMSKLTEGMDINRSEVEKEIREDAEENLKPSHYRDFYEKNRDRLYRRTAEAKPPAAEPAPQGARPPVPPDGPPARPESAPRNKADYIPYYEIPDRVREDLIRQRTDETFNKRRNEEIRKRLDNIYRELEDYVKAFHRVDTRAVARETLRDVSMGNLLEKLTAFLKLTTADARRREGVADLKAFADRHDCVEYLPEGDFFSNEDAAAVPRIGGGDLAKLATDYDPEDPGKGRYVDIDGFASFSEEAETRPEERRVFKGALSGILKPDEGDDRFIFRLLDVQERELPDFDKLAETNPALRERVREDYIDGLVKKEAYRLLRDHRELLETIIKKETEEEFDFEFEAKMLARNREKYRAGLDRQNGEVSSGEGEDENFGIKQTEYFFRNSREIEGIDDADVEDFIAAAFDLDPRAGKPAIVRELPEKPGKIDEEKDFFYIIMLVEEKDKPIRHPSRERYNRHLPMLVYEAMTKYPEAEYEELDDTEKMMLKLNTTPHVQDQLKKRFDAVAGTFKKVSRGTEEEDRR